MKENIQALFDSNSEKCSLQCVRARHVNYSVGRCALIESRGGGSDHASNGEPNKEDWEGVKDNKLIV